MAAQSANADALGIVQVGKAGGEPQRISELQGLFVQGQFNADATVVRFTNGGNAPAVCGDAGRLRPECAAKALSRGIEIVRDYTDEQGKPVTQVTLGQKINVHLKVRANSKEGQSNGDRRSAAGRVRSGAADAAGTGRRRRGERRPRRLAVAAGRYRLHGRRITAISVKIG